MLAGMVGTLLAYGTTWDETRYVHDPATGLLKKKIYADGHEINYTYTAWGYPKRITYASGKWMERFYNHRLQTVSNVSAGATKLVKAARLSKVEKICPGVKKLEVTFLKRDRILVPGMGSRHPVLGCASRRKVKSISTHLFDKVKIMEKYEVVSIIEDLMSHRSDIENLSITINEDGVDVYYEGGPALLDDTCIFDDCPQATKEELLRFYFSKKFIDAHFSWDIGIEFAKFSAKYGMFVEQEAEAYFPSDLRQHWIRYFLHIAYFGSSSKYEARLVELMDVACEDARDGLFIACWFNRSARIQNALMSAFCKWLKLGELEPATGEIIALKTFMQRWKNMDGMNICAQLDDFLKKIEE